jgi:ribokinase
VAAVQLARLAGRATFLTALASDDVGAALRAELGHRGVTLHAAARPGRHRRAVTHLDAATGERTITILGERIVPHGDDPLPWTELEALDAVYVTAGDAVAARAARAARVLVATARGIDALADAAVELDVLVSSAADAREDVDPTRLPRPPRLTVRTEGDRGGGWTAADGTTGRWTATAPPGPAVDAYGCGDAFAAGLTFGLGAGLDVPAALRLGAPCGAHCLAGRGPYEGQLELMRR